MAAGLILTVVALFMLPMSVKETSTAINRDDFVQDELELEYFHEGGRKRSAWIVGHLVSTGEQYSTSSFSLDAMNRLRALNQEKRLAGHRFPVRYLPKQHGFWFAVDWLKQFRVQEPEHFDLGFPTGLVIANIVIGAVAVLMIRRGLGDSPALPAE